LSSSSDEFLARSLQFLKGVGPRRAAELAGAGLTTVEDLLHRFPVRYEDRSRLQPIAGLRPGVMAAIAGRVSSGGLRGTRRPGFKVFEALVTDDSGAVRVAWLNQPFMRGVLPQGARVVLYGEVSPRGGGGVQLTNPQYEVVDEDGDETVHTGRIVPVYERVGTVTPKIFRRLVHDALAKLPSDLRDDLPEPLRLRLGLPAIAAALRAAHFPPIGVDIDELNRFATPAQRRLIFEEAFIFQQGVLARRLAGVLEHKATAVTVTDEIRDSARRVLPFRLTAGQRQALKEIVDDLCRVQPMNRILQGDVGAGKTIVALLAALVVMENGLQVAFMAPTEILAEQHARQIAGLLAHSRFKVALLTGSLGTAARREMLVELAAGEIHRVVGTHALVEAVVEFRRLGLVVIDEQHRFGVLQRATLREKGLRPDVLVMTATPIPRTLALTLYGDLDVSTIRERPPGRLPVRTVVCPGKRRGEVYRHLKEQLSLGHQAYIIYPLVEESEKSDLKAATQMADELAATELQGYGLALLHGRMKPEQKDRVMRAFAAGEVRVLVSTTVVEVGVDVANATVMIIEHAERFGLSQLHQLRGRVGRGPAQSSCWLLHEFPLSEDARRRLQAMAETNDGFAIADMDLDIRGPGDFFGTRQAGLPTFRTIDLARDRPVLELARAEAARVMAATRPDDPAVHRLLASWGARFKLAEVG
jgi:ATP-dependent DNA helicase RecG